MKNAWRGSVIPVGVLLSVVVLTTLAFAAQVSVDCSSTKNNSIKSINSALAGLNKQGPNTVLVSGTCNEAVVIEGFDGLDLIATPGASINDPTPFVPDDNVVINITSSRNVSVQGFTINGGAAGVVCTRFSVCNLNNLIVQFASAVGASYSFGSSGFIENSTIQNNDGTGVSVTVGGTVVLNSTTVQNNAFDGVFADTGSNLSLGAATITGNGQRGVFLRTSIMRSLGSTITGNAGNGVFLINLSFARFSGNTLTGNGVLDVNCGSVTAGAAFQGGTVGTTNCTSPAP